MKVGKKRKRRNPENSFETGKNFFKDFPNSQYQEDEEQSFQEFMETSPILERKQSIHVLFLKLKRIKEEKIKSLEIEEFSKSIEEYLNNFFDTTNSKFGKVKFLEPVEIIEKKNKKFYLSIPNLGNKTRRVRRKKEVKIRTRKGLDHSQMQLCVNDILEAIREHITPQKAIQDHAYNVVGIVMNDLFYSHNPLEGEEVNLFIAGLAHENQNVLSLGRYDPFYLEKSDTCEYETSLRKFTKKEKQDTISLTNLKYRKEKTLLRSIKTCSHEILHNCGLDHCSYKMCLMNSTDNIEQDLSTPFFLCNKCLQKLNFFASIDVVKRYENLRRWFANNHLHKEADWLKRRISYLKSPKTKEVIDISDDDSDIEIIQPKKKKRKKN